MRNKRESNITIKSEHFAEQDIKFQINFRIDFGEEICSERLNYIRSFGADPAANIALFTNEFENAETAHKAKEFISEMKANEIPGHDISKAIELLKAEGSTLVVGIRAKERICKDMEIMKEIAVFFGDFVHVHQFLDLSIAESRNLSEILFDPEASPLASAISSFRLRMLLSSCKELPIKISEYVSTKDPSKEKHYKLIGEMLGAFHHLNLDIELREPSKKMKGAYKKDIVSAIMMVTTMLYNIAKNLGILEIAKSGGPLTKVIYCIPPFLSFEITLLAPTSLQSLEKFNSPEFMKKFCEMKQSQSLTFF